MNEKDLKIGELLRARLSPGEVNMISVRQQFLARMNLITLKVLLEDEKKKGVAVVLDRPHQYLAYLLHLHHINQKNISYVDAITHFSGETVESSPNSISYTDGPFHIELLLNAFGDGYNGDFHKKPINLREMDFILIDNMSTMLNYNTMSMISDFLQNFFQVIGDVDGLSTIFPLDSQAHSELHNLVSPYVHRNIDMREVWKRTT